MGSLYDAVTHVSGEVQVMDGGREGGRDGRHLGVS